MVDPCNVAADQQFGPGVRCSQFDFTLTFEQSILGIGISSILLLLFPFRLKELHNASVKTLQSPIYIAKLTFCLAFVSLQTAILVLWAIEPLTSVSIASGVLGLLSAFAIIPLLIVEHNRTTRPSTLITIYLFAAIVADCVQLRTLFGRKYVPTIARIVTASAASKFLILLLESWPKTSYLKQAEEPFGPEDVTGPWGRIVFWWLKPLLLLGNQNLLLSTDLPPLDHQLYSRELQTRMISAWERNKSGGTYSIVYTAISCFRWELLGLVLPRLALIGFNYAQTFLITATINYLERPAANRNINHANGLIGAAVLTYVGSALATAKFNHKLFRVITMYRGGTASLIYYKALSSSSGYNQMAAITLMSTDIDTVGRSIQYFNDLWARVIEIAVGVWLLWRQLGPVAIAPILVSVICALGQSCLSAKTGEKQGTWIKAVQRRVGTTSTVLRSMKSIKLAGLVESIHELLQAERIRELNLAKRFRLNMVYTNVAANGPNALSALVIFAAYSVQAKVKGTPPLSTAQAFTAIGILGLLGAPTAVLLSTIPQVLASSGSFKRIREFLLDEGFNDRRTLPRGSNNESLSKTEFKRDLRVHPNSSTESVKPTIIVSDLILGSTPDARDTNKPVTFEAENGTFTMIIGPVGSGKSTLLKAILGEWAPEKGSVTIDTLFVGYCSQSPWLQNRSIRENIIGTGVFDMEWYTSVLNICALEQDMSQLPLEDLTIVGSRGVVLSGGQKHRIALARAIYSRCSVLVLDDFLSSLDRKTQRLIAYRLFSKNDHAQLRQCTTLLVTHTTRYAHLADNLVVLSATGSLEYSGPPTQWISSNDDLSEDQDHEIPEILPSAFTPHKSEDDIVSQEPKGEFNISVEATKRQTGDIATWTYYFKSIGALRAIVAVSLVVTTVFANNFQKLWLKWNTGPATNLARFIGVYAIFSTIAFVFQGLMIAQVLLVIAPRSGLYLHDVLVTAALKAPMSLFDKTDSSVLLNRFSQDMTLIEMTLPVQCFLVSIQLGMCIMAIALIAIGSTYMAATIPIAVFALYWIQRFYLRTSRQIRLLDLELKSPLYKHFTETIEGVSTIRAFGWQSVFDQTAIDKLNESQKPYYLLYCIQRWLNLVLDFLVAILAVALIALALLLPEQSNPGSLGVALTSVLAFNGSLQALIMAWTEAETALGSVARTKSFEEDTPAETLPDYPLDPSLDWPQGAIDFLDVSVTYGETVALQDVSFTIAAGQKFGIVGRTGSGKSTLLTSLLRLIDPTSGIISIDGLDISRIPRNAVRDRLICLPQDALTFPGTFRFNLVPDSRVLDTTAIVSSLKRVGLWTLVEQRGGLEAELTPDTLSHGEQQLLALARAILRKDLADGKCILVLDEATSNLDKATEDVIQRVITEEFYENTVITVAHRLETVRNADMILMLEKGRAVKIGKPEEVL